MTFKNIPSGDSSPRQLAQSTARSNGRRLCKGTVDILKVAMRKNVSFIIHELLDMASELQYPCTMLMVCFTHLKVILSIDIRLG